MGAPNDRKASNPDSTSSLGKQPSTTSPKRPGEVFAAYLILTGAARFLVEFIRINPRSFLGMSNAQTAAAASMIAGIILWRWTRRRNVSS